MYGLLHFTFPCSTYWLYWRPWRFFGGKARCWWSKALVFALYPLCWMRSSHQDSASHGPQVAMWRRLSGGWQHAVSPKRTWSCHRQKVKTSFNRTTLTTVGLRWKSWKFLPFSVRLLSRLHRLKQIDRNQHLRPLGDAHPQALDWLAFAIWCWEPWVSCETCEWETFQTSSWSLWNLVSPPP